MLNEEKTYKILMWDDAGFWMHKPDSLEKIIDESKKLIADYEEYNRCWNRKPIINISDYFQKRMDQNLLSLRLISLANRMERLKKK